MASDREMKRVYEELASLRKIVRGMHRMGTIEEVENGKHRVRLQPGDVGDGDSKEDTTPWIRSGHGGGVVEDRQYVKGETVHVFCPGGNMEHAMILPGGFSDAHPQDKNSKKDNSTRRWRKPPKEEQGQQSGKDSAGGSGGGDGQYGAKAPQHERWEDAEEDHQEVTTHEKRWHKIGDTEYTVTKDGGEIKHGKRTVKVDKETVSISDGEGTLTIKGGAAVFKGKSFTAEADTITLKGNVALGGQGGKPIALQGSIDTRGDSLIGSLATKVTAT